MSMPQGKSAFSILGLFIPLLIMTSGFKFISEKHDRCQESEWNAPKWADTLTNEKLLDINFIQSGKELYHSYCLVCHGPKGKGDGDSGFGLEVPAGDFTDEAVIEASNGALFWKITNGRIPMPRFKERLSEEKRWKIVAYIRELQRQNISRKGKSKNKSERK